MNLATPTPRNALEAKEHAQWIAFAPFVFQASKVLRDSGILAALDATRQTGLTLEETVERVKLPQYGVRVLLEAGLGIGLVEETAGRYRATKTARFLLHDSLTRANMDFTHDVSYRGLFKLDEAVREGRPAGLSEFGDWPTIYHALAELPEKVRRSWFAFDHHFSDTAFPDALPLVFRHKPRKLLDIGGNTGRWTEQCLRHDANVAVTILDLPGQLRDAKIRLDEAGLSQRVTFHASNLLDEQSVIPRGYDAVWMSQFLDCFSEAQIVSILRRCAQAMDSSSRMYILEPFWDRQRYPTTAFCLQMISLYFTSLANGTSQMYRSSTFLRCVAAAGLEIEAEHDHLGLSHTLLVCRLA